MRKKPRYQKIMRLLLTALIFFAAMIATRAEEMDTNEVFEHINGRTFTFASGVGAWSTEMTMGEKGSFSGSFYDADMGDSGDGYPDGTLYACHFFGMFAEVETLDPYTYVLRLTALSLKEAVGVEQIVGDMRVISAEAYGMQGGDIFLLCYPGRETASLPAEFLEWIRMPNAWDEVPAILPCYGLYNVNAETGFFSHTD